MVHVPRREPLLAGDEFLSGETGQYQRPLVLVKGTLHEPYKIPIRSMPILCNTLIAAANEIEPESQHLAL